MATPAIPARAGLTSLPRQGKQGQNPNISKNQIQILNIHCLNDFPDKSG
jgi:hypothetical protein